MDREVGMIEQTLERWHAFVRGELPDGLDDLLADDATFWSPIVFTPQEGKELTSAYLMAAYGLLGGGGGAGSGDGGKEGGFRYVKETTGGDHAILEFETTVDGTYVNGVDIITCDADGRISDFKVMIRPLRAVNLLHERMRALLEQMATLAEPSAGAGG